MRLIFALERLWKGISANIPMSYDLISINQNAIFSSVERNILFLTCKMQFLFSNSQCLIFKSLNHIHQIDIRKYANSLILISVYPNADIKFHIAF